MTKAPKVGDVIRLNSGSPMMTVTEVVGLPQAGPQSVKVAWTDNNGALQYGQFPVASVR